MAIVHNLNCQPEKIQIDFWETTWEKDFWASFQNYLDQAGRRSEKDSMR